MNDPGTFRFAPLDWNPAAAQKVAAQEGLTLGQAHWDLVRALQEYYARNPALLCPKPIKIPPGPFWPWPGELQTILWKN